MDRNDLTACPWTKADKKTTIQEEVLIFRTSVKSEQDLAYIKVLFARYPQIHRWNVDFEDWEKILRVECIELSPIDISNALQTIGICAKELE